MIGVNLIHIDPRQYKYSRDQAEGALATAKAQYAGQQLAAEIAKKNFPALLEQAKAQLESAKANLAKTQADYDRQISLRKPATTQQDVDQAATALWQAEAQVKLAEAQVKQFKGQVEQTQAQLDQAELNLSWTTVAATQRIRRRRARSPRKNRRRHHREARRCVDLWNGRRGGPDDHVLFRRRRRPQPEECAPYCRRRYCETPPGEAGNVGSQPPPSALKSCTRFSDTYVVLVAYCCSAYSNVRSASSTVRKSPTPAL
jgi:hypothetical protein